MADQADRDIPTNVKSLSLGWIIGFLLTVSFVGLFLMVPLAEVRIPKLSLIYLLLTLFSFPCLLIINLKFPQMMIIKYKLTYPTGTATAYLINSFHTPRGAKLAG